MSNIRALLEELLISEPSVQNAILNDTRAFTSGQLNHDDKAIFALGDHEVAKLSYDYLKARQNSVLLLNTALGSFPRDKVKKSFHQIFQQQIANKQRNQQYAYLRTGNHKRPSSAENESNTIDLKSNQLKTDDEDDSKDDATLSADNSHGCSSGRNTTKNVRKRTTQADTNPGGKKLKSGHNNPNGSMVAPPAVPPAPVIPPAPTVPPPSYTDPSSQNHYCTDPAHRGLEDPHHFRASHANGIAKLAREWQSKRTVIAVEKAKAKAAGNMLEHQKLSEIYAETEACAGVLTALAELKPVVIDF